MLAYNHETAELHLSQGKAEHLSWHLAIEVDGTLLHVRPHQIRQIRQICQICQIARDPLPPSLPPPADRPIAGHPISQIARDPLRLEVGLDQVGLLWRIVGHWDAAHGVVSVRSELENRGSAPLKLGRVLYLGSMGVCWGMRQGAGRAE